MKVSIVPPFYKNFWFWMIVTLVLGGMIAWAIRIRIHQLNSRLQLETALAESERKALRLQMNPHFISMPWTPLVDLSSRTNPNKQLFT